MVFKACVRGRACTRLSNQANEALLRTATHLCVEVDLEPPHGQDCCPQVKLFLLNEQWPAVLQHLISPMNLMNSPPALSGRQRTHLSMYFCIIHGRLGSLPTPCIRSRTRCSPRAAASSQNLSTAKPLFMDMLSEWSLPRISMSLALLLSPLLTTHKPPLLARAPACAVKASLNRTQSRMIQKRRERGAWIGKASSRPPRRRATPVLLRLYHEDMSLWAEPVLEWFQSRV